MLKGIYVSVEPFHLENYLNEMVCRFNYRKNDDVRKLLEVIGGLVGCRRPTKRLPPHIKHTTMQYYLDNA
jgi:hypothetical protein